MQNCNYLLNVQREGVYFVEDGDTLDSIADKFSTTKELIVKENRLENGVNVGDIIYIKSYKTVYTIKVEDTPETVAKALNLSVEEMYRINKINYVYPFMKVVSDN